MSLWFAVAASTSGQFRRLSSRPPEINHLPAHASSQSGSQLGPDLLPMHLHDIISASLWSEPQLRHTMPNQAALRALCISLPFSQKGIWISNFWARSNVVSNEDWLHVPQNLPETLQQQCTCILIPFLEKARFFTCVRRLHSEVVVQIFR